MASLDAAQKGWADPAHNSMPDNSNEAQQHHHQQQHPPSNPTPEYLQTFRKGEGFALGVVQIMTGITVIILGSLLRSSGVGQTSITNASKIPSWGGTMFIISGAVSAFADRMGSRGQVKASMIFNIISAIEAGIAVIIFSVDLSRHSTDTCVNDGSGVAYNQCVLYRYAYLVLVVGILIFLLTLALLEFCISISSSVFGCKSVCCKSDTEQPRTMAYNASEQPAAVPPMQPVGATGPYEDTPPPYENLAADHKPAYGTNWVEAEELPPKH